MATKKTFEAAAQVLAEAKVLGLFAEGTAHELVTTQFAEIFEKMNPNFDKGRFIVAAGVKIENHSDEIGPGCSNRWIGKL